MGVSAPASINRAYSLLTVKAVDGDQRVIAGVATTPTPDRVNDIIEPLGVTFKNPLPLLLYHDSRMPVGTVKFDKPTKQGVTFTAELPEITEPGTLKDRVDEAWQSIKARLIRGVSIGFRPINDAVDYMQDTGGFRFRETEVLELSLVAIPANAEATITTVKQFDTAPADAGGTIQRSTTATAVATERRVVKAASPLATAMKTIQEQKAAFQATRETKAARMTEIMTKAAEAGVTLDEKESEEYDGLEHRPMHRWRDHVPRVREAGRRRDDQPGGRVMDNVTEQSLHIFGASTVRRAEFTVSEYARIEQVDRKTVLRWIAKGALDVRRTPGGHFRIFGTR